MRQGFLLLPQTAVILKFCLLSNFSVPFQTIAECCCMCYFSSDVRHILVNTFLKYQDVELCNSFMANNLRHGICETHFNNPL